MKLPLWMKEIVYRTGCWILLLTLPWPIVGCRTVQEESGAWEDAFDDGADWQLSTDAVADVSVTDGALVVHVFAPGQIAWAMSERRWGDLRLTVEATHVSGPDDNEYGVLIRMQQTGSSADAFYAFSISGDGYARIARFGNGTWTVLGSDWSPSPAIRQGEATNVLEVVAQGTAFEFIINGEPVLQIEDVALKTGSIGVYAGAFAEGGVVVAFDNLQVSPLP
jgi:hypothetical protein